MAGAKHILLVEDDRTLCDATSIGLNRRGYAVSGFVDPAAARAAFEHDPAVWDLVITDQHMPGLSGVELSRIVKERRRELPVILWSRAPPDSLAATAAAAGADRILYKPVEPCELIGAIRTLLDAAAGERR